MNVDASVDIRELSKTFAGQRALVDVAMTVRPGEIHALLGQNGSGKSTLIKVLAGVYTPDPGSVISVYGETLRPGLPRESRRLGLQFVHQALGIIGELTAVENIALGFGYRRRGRVFIDWSAQRAKTRRLLRKLSVEFDIDAPVSTLRPVDRSAIAIARALDDDDSEVRVLVLDEPTAALPPHEVELLFGLVRQASEAGTSVIYVSHRLNEIFELADRATVLRDGVNQGTVSVSDVDPTELVRMIVGEAVEVSGPPTSTASIEQADVALSVSKLIGMRLDDIAFEVRAGEVLGIAGLTGSGREEFAGALVGERHASVTLEAHGARVDNPTPRQAMGLGVVLVLPNRTAGAAAKQMSIAENITLPSLRRYGRMGFVRRRSEAAATTRWIDKLQIRPRDPERAYSLLSGGNQQKVIMAKWLNAKPNVLVVEDPTSGVDVGARQAIYDLIREQAAHGMAFIVCSSDSDDLCSVCDRVLVLSEGRFTAELIGSDIDEPGLLMAMLSTDGSRGAA